ncbi:MipA/OmpV family protein [Inquilinus sp. CAU 1745]|uniref:MipA/OmpV family protein n=1 Tax=Inquilinus sp. CAU 1745 TaxID=3140369 RepID=UPI00325B7D51
MPNGRLFLAALATSSLALPGLATAQDDGPPADGFQVTLGAGAMYAHDYRGGEDYEFQPLPIVGLRYQRGAMSFELQGLSAKAGIEPVEGLRLGPIVRYAPGRDSDLENEAVSRLSTIDDSVEVGGFLEYQLYRDQYGREVEMGLQALADVNDGHGGMLAEASVEYGMPLTESLHFSIGANTVWVDGDYMNTVFGVTPEGSAASGLPVYSPGSGIESAGLEIGLRYDLSHSWTVMTRASYERLMGDAADSPIVSDEGSPDQFQLGVGVAYRF